MPTTLRSRPMMNAAERDAVALRHAILLEHASQRSWRPLIIAVTVVAYCLFSWWMFNVGDTLRRANWALPAPISPTGCPMRCARNSTSPRMAP